MLLDGGVQRRDDGGWVGITLRQRVHSSGSCGNGREDRKGRDQQTEELHLEDFESWS
jgi:hypothetical protein